MERRFLLCYYGRLNKRQTQTDVYSGSALGVLEDLILLSNKSPANVQKNGCQNI